MLVIPKPLPGQKHCKHQALQSPFLQCRWSGNAAATFCECQDPLGFAVLGQFINRSWHACNQPTRPLCVGQKGAWFFCTTPCILSVQLPVVSHVRRRTALSQMPCCPRSHLPACDPTHFASSRVAYYVHVCSTAWSAWLVTSTLRDGERESDTLGGTTLLSGLVGVHTPATSQGG